MRKASGGFAAFVASAYASPDSFGVIFRFCFAIWRTATTRCTISLRVKPSGKTTRNTGGFGTAAGTVAGATSALGVASDRAADEPDREAHEPDQQYDSGDEPANRDHARPDRATVGEIALEQVRRRPRVLRRSRRWPAVRERRREALVEGLDRHVDGLAQRDRNRCVSSACGPTSPRNVKGRPTTTRSAPSSTTSSASRRSPASLAACSTTPTGRASVPVASETATPVRAEP